MDLNEVMAVNLRRIRHGKKLTQEELAHRTGLSTRHISAIERAEMSATLTVLGQISDALGVEPAELVTKSN
ncbi:MULTISPECIES: helix-turn-helix domain-containing protein [Sinorhizobium]|uniref:Transcriptional regulator n=1 Tax=Sinorhizobium americanum TaxID=194963 RepID=A0A2S3YUF3_9HYPH|nr:MULTISPECIES: helix-turn-helix transcriptional regulator [Sinorhizobium]PDT39338.1 transcriptional regulator [Sinorhizobium sp. FG01]PDT50725.1 transcriptional regulator [Sinorhizobium sp. NG07B]POH34066.1 transcriptional regulator [Sinorhizobium americanum]POH35269.1 transcriptional regulator [Sinorhizobium americanum]